MTNSPPAMTVRDVAGYLNVNEKTVYRLAQRRELPGFKKAPRAEMCSLPTACDGGSLTTRIQCPAS